ncbi:hypothetical protein CALVIDRAFT_563004 [Calocera viscosa TUFC12733]|uniref:DRBM domain-containing protein n=1 Tax=Calocera viscosa (strain TUFC12733) TaxID=1330018 RepID=A0A167NFZ4_CALVF|nr:hypothetical protein CALVIDRAFT_563004 [Calocera viscosa TUFC12733]
MSSTDTDPLSFDPVLRSAVLDVGGEDVVVPSLQTAVNHDGLRALGRHVLVEMSVGLLRNHLRSAPLIRLLAYEQALHDLGIYASWCRDYGLTGVDGEAGEDYATAIWTATFGALCLLSRGGTARAMLSTMITRLENGFWDALEVQPAVVMHDSPSALPCADTPPVVSTSSSPVSVGFPLPSSVPFAPESNSHLGTSQGSSPAISKEQVIAQPLLFFNQMAAQRGVNVQKKFTSRGPEHQREWSAYLYIDGQLQPCGVGEAYRTKKSAESAAALSAMRVLQWIEF